MGYLKIILGTQSVECLDHVAREKIPTMKKTNVVRNYFVLPCCLLLLNVCNSLVSYKAGMIADPLLRTVAIIFFVLVGSSMVAFIVSPAIEALVRTLQRTSRQGAGELGQVAFLILLGAGVFYLYYELYIYGPEAILPQMMRN
jgi:peptidoglycan/LPS O-acetylase OafA/YrhL